MCSGQRGAGDGRALRHRHRVQTSQQRRLSAGLLFPGQITGPRTEAVAQVPAFIHSSDRRLSADRLVFQEDLGLASGSVLL